MTISELIFSLVGFLFCLGLFGSFFLEDKIKKLISLSIMQSACILFFLLFGYVSNSSPPIINEKMAVYTNPLPSALMLTAIVVSLAITSIGFALIIKIKKLDKPKQEH